MTTRQQYEEMKRRTESKTPMPRNFDKVSLYSFFEGKVAAPKPGTISPIVGLPQTEEDKLNKTEKAYLNYLRILEKAGKLSHVSIQGFTFKLADDCRFTPDFSYVDAGGRFVLVDVKGFQREDALLKIKFAARTIPYFDWRIVKKEGNGWCETKVKP